MYIEIDPQVLIALINIFYPPFFIPFVVISIYYFRNNKHEGATGPSSHEGS